MSQTEVDLRKRIQRSIKNLRDEQAEAVSSAADAATLKTSGGDEWAVLESKLLGYAAELDTLTRSMDRAMARTFGQAIPS